MLVTCRDSRLASLCGHEAEFPSESAPAFWLGNHPSETNPRRFEKTGGRYGASSTRTLRHCLAYRGNAGIRQGEASHADNRCIRSRRAIGCKVAQCLGSCAGFRRRGFCGCDGHTYKTFVVGPWWQRGRAYQVVAVGFPNDPDGPFDLVLRMTFVYRTGADGPDFRSEDPQQSLSVFERSL